MFLKQINCWILLNGVLTYLLLDLLTKFGFFFPQTAQFDTGINLFCLVFVRLEFLFWVFFFYIWHNKLALFLYEAKPSNLFYSNFFCRCDNFHQFLLQVYSHGNVAHYTVFASCFFLQMNFLFSSALIVPWLKWHHIFWILILF